ncbi:MAG: nucleoside 2-deoxyribosyltransferase [Chloroflexi bacterium]|nr:nucleoside 2-deoxyribosyltransferase [Chloroflexota bacterium]
MEPNFERLRKAFLLEGEPDRVPLYAGVDRDVMSGFLGRRVTTLADEIEFRVKAGFDYVGLGCGLGRQLRGGPGYRPFLRERGGISANPSSRRAVANYSVYTDTPTERVWEEEGTGVIASLADFEAYPWPKAEDLDYTNFEKIGPLLPPGMKVIASMGFIMGSNRSLLGQENLFISLYDNPDLVARMFERVGSIQYQAAEIVTSFDCVGALIMPDDIAYNRGLMIAPRFLRQYLFPWYKRIGDLCKRKGIPYLYHSDGDVSEVMEDIIDCGFRGLNPIQPQAMDIVEVKRKYGHRLCLIGNIDPAYTLTRGTPQDVEGEVKLRIKQLAPGGGYCLASGSGSIPDYVPLANFKAMVEAALKYGKYPINL